MSDLRERLIDVAADLLEESGPAGVTLREVGRRAGVSHNAPYRHFVDKQHLLAAVAALGLARLGHAAAHQHGDPLQSVASMARAYVQLGLERPQQFSLMSQRWPDPPDELATAGSATHRLLVDAVSRAQANGHLPHGDPERLASLVHAVAHGAAGLSIAGHLSPQEKGHSSAHDLVDDLLQLLAGRRRPDHAGDGQFT